MRLKFAFFLLLYCMANLFANAQNVGIGTNSPDGSAMLDISSTNKGLLIPRMTLAQRDAVVTPKPGLQVYVTDDSSIYLFNGTIWGKIQTGNSLWELQGNKMYNAAAQKVGINTTTAAGEFHVKSASLSNAVIDQQEANNATNVGGGNTHWQSFTAGATGLLTHIDLPLNSPLGSSTSPGTIKIYAGEGVSGTLLSTATVTYGNIPGFLWQSFPFPDYVNIISGNLYTIQFSAPVSTAYWVAYNNNNPYAGGRADFGVNVDYLFKTYVTTVSDALVVTNEKVGIGTSSPLSKLDIAGNIKITDGTQGAGKVLTSDANGLASWATPTGGGLIAGTAAGNTPYWDGANWVTNSSNIYNNGSNVGVGNATPAAKLDIAGNIKITDGTQAAGKVLTSDANGLASWATPSGGGLSAGTVAGNTPYWNGANWITNSSNIFNNGGNVGIGTTSPAGELHVKSSTQLSNTVDQQQLTNNSLPGTSSPLWQSFTAGITGQLTQVDLHVGAPNGGSTPGTLKIYSGEGTGGALLSTTAVNFVNPLGLKSFTLSSPVTVVTGNKYTIEVASTYPVAAAWMAGNNSSSYLGGITNYAANFPNLDFAFRTYVTPTVSVEGLIVSGGKVGVGTSAPTADFEVKNSTTNGLIKLNAPNIEIGGYTAIVQGRSASTANQAEWVFQYAGPGSSGNAHAFGFNNVQPFVFFTAGQNVGIGTSAPTARLSVNGAANNTSGSWGVFSDARIKTVNHDFTDGLNVINKIRPVTFNYNSNAPFKEDGEQVGIVAQELEAIAPYMVSKKANGDIKDLREVNNQAYVFLLINAVKELSKQNEDLKKELDLIKKKSGL